MARPRDMGSAQTRRAVNDPDAFGVRFTHRTGGGHSSSGSIRGLGYLAVQRAGELRNLWPRRVPGFLKDRRDLGVGDEVLPAFLIPVEEHPNPALLIGIAKDVRTLGPVLLSLLKACG